MTKDSIQTDLINGTQYELFGDVYFYDSNLDMFLVRLNSKSHVTMIDEDYQCIIQALISGDLDSCIC